MRPQLRTVPGVADVDSPGGYVKQYVVEPDPAKLTAYGISYGELGEALEKANLSVGADFIQRSGESYMVRGDARIRSADEILRAVIATVARNLTEGALLVIAILFLMLGNWRAALIATLVIPLPLLFSASGMNVFKISGNLMSLGALDFGLIIDGAVTIVDNTLRRMAERQQHEGRILNLQERLEVALRSTQEMVCPTVYGQIVILLVFLPCLTFQGVEGKMFSPMVITLMLALASAFVLSLTFVPAMTALMIHGHISEKEVPAVAKTKEAYNPWLYRAVARPWPFIGAAVGVFVLCMVAFNFVGREFMPMLDEQNLNLSSVRILSTSIDKSGELDLLIERAILTLPEVKTVYSKAGTASLAADPMPPNASDNYVILKPKKDWPDGVKTKEQVIQRIRKATDPVVGNFHDATQPIEMRFNELIGGVRSDVAVKLYGEDLGQMTATADQIVKVLRSVPGASDARVAQTEGFPTFDIKFRSGRHRPRRAPVAQPGGCRVGTRSRRDHIALEPHHEVARPGRRADACQSLVGWAR